MRSSGEEERVAFLGSSIAPSPSRTSETDTAVDSEVVSKRLYSRSRASRIASWLRSRLRLGKRSFRRHPIFVVIQIIKFLAVLLVAILVLTPIFAPSYLRPPSHYEELKLRCQGGAAAESGCANPYGEKVFISVSLYDKGGHLAGGDWGNAVIELIHLIGADNVFLSIYENDSGPEGIAALEDLKSRVPCSSHIVSDVHVPLDGFPNITMPDGSQRTKRLAYLSEMRNRALRPLDTLGAENGFDQFDKILFLNDVAFRPVDAAQLLFSTNLGADGRTHYLSTCSLDYKNPFLMYDLYAQRDAEGYSNGLPLFPIFSGAGQGLSKSDMLAQTDAVRVSSCWGGMVAMQASYVQNLNESLPFPGFQSIGSHVIEPADPAKVSAPVRFRYEPDIFFDACECCLFLADVSQAARSAGAKETGVFINPYVRVAYDWGTLGWLPVVQRWERLFTIPQSILTPLLHLPTHNPHRAVREGEIFTEEFWDNASGQWKLEQRVARNGLFCGVREMQLLQQGERQDDVNWLNTKIPAGQALNFPT